MARTRAEIEQVIEDAKNGNATLSVIDSVSSTAIWLTIKKVVAFAIWVFEVIMDKYKEEINNSASSAVYGHDEWWIRKMYEFQYGDSLAIKDIDGKKLIYYATVDETKQIIKRASIKNDGLGGSVIKVATDTGALSTPQLNAVLSYVNKLQAAGTKLSVLSKNSDEARYFITIYYDPLVPFDDIESYVEDAINDYHTKLDFDGGVDLRTLEDKIQDINKTLKTKAIVSFVTTNAEAKPAGGVYASFNRRYETISGYIKVADGFPAKSTTNGGTITYIPNI